MDSQKTTQWLASINGRVARALLGLVLSIGGILIAGNSNLDEGSRTVSAFVAILGLLPMLGGILNFSILSAILGGPFWGKDKTTEVPKSMETPSFSPHSDLDQRKDRTAA